MNDVNIFKQIFCSVIGLKLLGSPVSPFLYIKIVAAKRQHFGISLVSMTFDIRSDIYVFKNGHLLKTITEI